MIVTATTEPAAGDDLAGRPTRSWIDTGILCVCQRMHDVALPVLYKHNARIGNSSALSWAADRGFFNTTRIALQYGAKVNAENEDPDPTRIAEIVRTSSPMTGSPPGFLPEPPVCFVGTALHYAARRGHDDIVRLLLSHDADIHAPSHDLCRCECTHIRYAPWKPLHVAMCSGHLSTVKLLGALHAETSDWMVSRNDLNFECAVSNSTALHSAAMHGDTDILDYILQNVDPGMITAIDSNNADVFHYAAYSYCREDTSLVPGLIRTLAAARGRVSPGRWSMRDRFGNTPLLAAIKE